MCPLHCKWTESEAWSSTAVSPGEDWTEVKDQMVWRILGKSVKIFFSFFPPQQIYCHFWLKELIFRTEVFFFFFTVTKAWRDNGRNKPRLKFFLWASRSFKSLSPNAVKKICTLHELHSLIMMHWLTWFHCCWHFTLNLKQSAAQKSETKLWPFTKDRKRQDSKHRPPERVLGDVFYGFTSMFF